MTGLVPPEEQCAGQGAVSFASGIACGYPEGATAELCVHDENGADFYVLGDSSQGVVASECLVTLESGTCQELDPALLGGGTSFWSSREEAGARGTLVSTPDASIMPRAEGRALPI